ncbi:MAG TPA: TonB-dependent receptor [Pyrinomonadaceae bacterium]|nr:TonB-dependent receptor [Pyrinomonadaceae bacterium]
MNQSNHMLRFGFTVIVALLISLCAAAGATAQIDTASLTGAITDANGGVIAGARVAVVNRATNISLETTTKEDGYYTFSNLRPGVYEITVEQAGFKRETRSALQLSVGQRARLDFSLTVGQVTEAVTVTGDTLILQRDDASLGNVVDNHRITTLPLLQRSWDDLLTQVAGTQGDPYTEQSGGTASGRTGAVNIHGARSLTNNFILDGQDNNSISENVQELSTQVARPSVDAIGEFKVITSQYSADTGRSAGGVVSVTTKSGSNQFHGVGYEYLRNRVFDANDFFSNSLGRAKPQRVQNQFGGNVGGPIVHDRAFFFVDYEGTRIRQGVLRIATVPLAIEKAGNFSANLGPEILVSGQRVPILNPDGTPSGQFVRQGQLFDPRTQVANPLFNAAQPASPLNPQFIRQPFAGNIISNIDPTAAKLAGQYPGPTLPGRANNFARTPSISDDQNRLISRVDYKLNSRNDIFGRYAFTKRNRFVPGFFGGVPDGTDTSAWGRSDIKSHSLTIGWNRMITPTIVNEFRFGYSRSKADTVQDPFGQGSSSDFVPGVPNNPEVQGGLPAVLISGFSPRLGSPDFLPKFQHSQQFQYTDTLTWTRGVHAFRFGADLMLPLHLDYLDVPNTRGRLTYDGSYTQFAGGLSGTGSALADFLVGTARNAALSNLNVVNQRRYMFAFFGQDDWKLTPRLTLNLGLRYDFGSPAYEENNRLTNLDPVAADNATNNAQAMAALRLAADGSLATRALVNPDRTNFAPRIGFSYSPAEKWVVRGGYGIYYNLLDRMGSEDQLSLNPPWLVNFNFTSNTLTPAATFITGFPPNTLDPATVNLTQVQLRAANPNARTSYIQQYSFGIQREFARDWLAEVAYVGTKGTHLFTLRDLNQPLPGQTSLPRDQRFPFPAFGLVEYRDDNGISNYNSMEATLDKRFHTGYTVRAVYTFSKSLDNSFEHLTSGGSNSFPQNARDLHSWYGLSDFNVRHRFVANGIWELPFGSGRRYVQEGWGARLLGGWELSGIINVRSGKPFTVTQSGDPLSLGSLSTILPDVIADPHISNPTIRRWFNPAAFQPLTATTNRFGTEGRNILIGPGFASLDFSIHRRFGLRSESRYLDFRWEVFNALNRANFGLPNRTINASNVGTITTLAGDPRVMQFALRLNF